MFSPTVFLPYPFFNGMSNLLFRPFGQNSRKPPQAPSVALPQDERCLRQVHLHAMDVMTSFVQHITRSEWVEFQLPGPGPTGQRVADDSAVLEIRSSMFNLRHVLLGSSHTLSHNSLSQSDALAQLTQLPCRR